MMRAALLLALAPLIGGCAAARHAAPLDAREVVFSGSAGGPVSLDAGPTPVAPSVSGALAYGLTDRATLHAGGGVTGGVTVLHMGASLEVSPPEGAKPRFMMDLTAYGAGREGAVEVFPDLTLLASWDLGERRHHLYVALDNLIQLGVTPEPFLWYPSPQLGGVAWIGSVGLQAQIGWHAPWLDNDNSPVSWLGVGDRGALSAQAGVVVRPWRTR